VNTASVKTVCSALVLYDLAPARAWLATALRAAFGEIEIHSADSVAAALALLARLPPEQPDIALIDLGLPDGSGLRVMEALTARGEHTARIVSTIFDDDAHIFPALRAGAQGYVLKVLPAAALASTLKGILEGQPALSPSIARRLLRQFSAPDSNPKSAQHPATASEHSADRLTPRETEVLQMIAKGYTVQQTASTLGLSPHTASGYVKDIYRKLSIDSRSEAAHEAVRRGLVAQP